MRGDSGQKRGHEDDTPASVHTLVAGHAGGGLRGKQFRLCANWRNRTISAGIAARDDVATWHRTGSRRSPHRHSHGRHRALIPWRESDDVAVGRGTRQHHDVLQHWGEFFRHSGDVGVDHDIRRRRHDGQRVGYLRRNCQRSECRTGIFGVSPTGMGLGSPVGRLGIPLGSTELGVGGLSPPPDVLSSTPSAPLSTFGTPCPTGTPAATAMSSGSC